MAPPGRSALMCAVIVEVEKRTVSCLPGLCTARYPLEEGLLPGIYSSAQALLRTRVRNGQDDN